MIVNLQDQALHRRIKECQALDNDLVHVLQIIQANGPSKGKRELQPHWSVQDGLILYSRRICLPEDWDLRRLVTSLAHDTIPAGHPGCVKMFDLVQRQYWWSGMRRFVYNYVDGCAICQSTKNLPNQPKAPLHPISPEKDVMPFSTVSLDFITELPLSNGFDAIVVFVDHDVTKAMVIAPCHTTIMAEQTADLYQNHVWCHFGLPSKVISDCGTQFTANFTWALCASLGIQQAMSMAYHPQMDGQTKHLNQELKQYLCVFCNLCQTDWTAFLATVEFSHNSHIHSTMEHSPFEALMGCNPHSLPATLPPTSVPSVTEWLPALTQLQSDLI